MRSMPSSRLAGSAAMPIRPWLAPWAKGKPIRPRRLVASWALYSEELASFDSTGFDQRLSTGQVQNFALQARMFLHLENKMNGGH